MPYFQSTKVALLTVVLDGLREAVPVRDGDKRVGHALLPAALLHPLCREISPKQQPGERGEEEKHPMGKKLRVRVRHRARKLQNTAELSDHKKIRCRCEVT